MLMKMISNSFFANISITKIILLTFLVILVLAVFFATIVLIYLTNIKNKRSIILKNLEYYQKITLKERLKRINRITQNNPQYKTTFNIWITRYKQFLKHDCQSVVKSFREILKLEKKKDYQARNKLIKLTFTRSNKIKEQISKLLAEIDFFISIDQLIREYQLFFKQNFNYLRSEIIKTELQNEINQEQLTEVINILETKFQELEENVNQAQTTNVINNLSEIAIGTTALAEILINLPSLSHQIYYLIPNRLASIKTQLTKSFQDHKMLNSFSILEDTVNKKITYTKQLINNLQYKKSKNQIREILDLINKFNRDLQEEENFSKLFIQKYTQFLATSLNLNQIFEAINQDFKEIFNFEPEFALNDQVRDLKNIIKQQLLTLNSIETQLMLENQKKDKTLSYQQLLVLLNDLLENSIICFNSISDYNQLLINKIKPKIIINSSIDKLNSMMLQIENILSNIKYFYLNEKYYQEFELFQNKLTAISETINNENKTITVENSSLIPQIQKLQTQVFHLYQELKIAITFYQLANSTLIYANRYRQDDINLNLQFKNIEDNIGNQNFQLALKNLINLMA